MAKLSDFQALADQMKADIETLKNKPSFESDAALAVVQEQADALHTLANG